MSSHKLNLYSVDDAATGSEKRTLLWTLKELTTLIENYDYHIRLYHSSVNCCHVNQFSKYGFGLGFHF